MHKTLLLNSLLFPLDGENFHDKKAKVIAPLTQLFAFQKKCRQILKKIEKNVRGIQGKLMLQFDAI